MYKKHGIVCPTFQHQMDQSKKGDSKNVCLCESVLFYVLPNLTLKAGVMISNERSVYFSLQSSKQSIRFDIMIKDITLNKSCLLYTSPSPRDRG